MPSGIKITDEIIGTGAVAEVGKVVVVHFCIRLNKGEERTNTYAMGQPARIHLGKRDVIAGLEQGIEGMRVGGKRELEVSPHLAYGEKGVPGNIPPNAVLRIQVELLGVREPGDVRPEDFPPGKQLIIGYGGNTVRNLAWWQFGVLEDGRCGVHFRQPQPGVNWRQLRYGSVQLNWSHQEAIEFIQEVVTMADRFPDECLRPDKCCVDHSEQAHPVTMDQQFHIPCISVYGTERGQAFCSYYIRENSPALKASKWFTKVSEIVAAQVSSHMRTAVEQKNRAKGNFQWGDM